MQSDAYFPITGPACNELERATVEQIRGRLVDAGLASDEEIDSHLKNVVAGRLDLATSPMISAWADVRSARQLPSQRVSLRRMMPRILVLGVVVASVLAAAYSASSPGIDEVARRLGRDHGSTVFNCRERSEYRPRFASRTALGTF